MASTFRGALSFFNDIGIYDVVLPFLLVFTIVFAILEKTKIFGSVKVDGKEYTRKNLNAMVAFVSSFIVVASSQIVAAINQAMGHVVLLLLVCVCFLILAGAFNKDEEFYLKNGWNKFFMIVVFVGILLIFANAVGWLGPFMNYLSSSWSSASLSGIILVIFVILIMLFITKEPKGVAKKEEK